MDPETTHPSSPLRQDRFEDRIGRWLDRRHVRRGTRLRRLAASTTAGGMMLVGLPFAVEYVVRPGDTVSEIAERHGTSASRLVERNDLHRSGDRILVGQTLHVPGSRDTTGRARPASRSTGRVSPDARRIVHYRVRPGDTPTELAVRFHAWTAELIEMNGSVLRVGERIRIPVVVAAAAKDRRSDRPARADRRSAGRPQQGRAGANPEKSAVRRMIARTARRHGVDPDFALAVSWQESGWQQDVVSSAGAIGAMQVMPSTGRWMSSLAGRRLHLRDLRDNVTAGVMLLDILEGQTRRRQVAAAGYYQGLAGVREHGMYRSTKQYVRNVVAIERQFEAGRYPA
jgi:LysM repeat protein